MPFAFIANDKNNPWLFLNGPGQALWTMGILKKILVGLGFLQKPAMNLIENASPGGGGGALSCREADLPGINPCTTQALLVPVRVMPGHSLAVTCVPRQGLTAGSDYHLATCSLEESWWGAVGWSRGVWSSVLVHRLPPAKPEGMDEALTPECVGEGLAHSSHHCCSRTPCQPVSLQREGTKALGCTDHSR